MLTKEEAAATERRKPMPTGLELAFGRKGKGPVGKRVRNALLTPILKKALTVESDVLPPGDAGALKSNISKELYVKIDPERTKAIVDVCRSKGVCLGEGLGPANIFFADIRLRGWAWPGVKVNSLLNAAQVVSTYWKMSGRPNRSPHPHTCTVCHGPVPARRSVGSAEEGSQD